MDVSQGLESAIEIDVKQLIAHGCVHGHEPAPTVGGPDQASQIGHAWQKYFALTSLVLWATFKFGAGADVSYKSAYAIVFYAALPGVIGSILGAISMFAGVNPEGFNVNNPVATNPAYFMDPATNKFLYGMASALDAIVIWTIILLGIGFSCNSKVKRTTAIVIVAAWYLFWKLGLAALAARS